MDFIDWFDIDDMDHLRAYKHLVTTGSWPKGFIPDNIEMNPGWQTTMAFGMANAYVILRMGQ